eukprot:m51a1_g4406 hypothetical protein (478) ;mRNA; f:426809-429022
MLSNTLLQETRRDFEAHPELAAWQRAVSRNSIESVAASTAVLTEGSTATFSHQLDQTWTVTNQQSSGRCWLFAGLNSLRIAALEKLGLKDFEFSQNYLYFWHKMEQANYLLNSIVRTRHLPADDRTVSYILGESYADGGQWDMFAALVRKYGLVPKPCMPETESSGSSHRLNTNVRALLREAARDIRAAASDEAADDVRQRAARGVFRVLCVHLGTPPCKHEPLEWQWRPDKKEDSKDKDAEKDKDKAESSKPMIGVAVGGVRRLAPGTTPLDFARLVLDEMPEESVSIVHDPRSTSPVNRSFTVDFLGNVSDAPPIKYVNVPIAALKDVAKRMLLDGRAVWFGCDHSKGFVRKEGVWDCSAYDFSPVYGLPGPTMTKADRLVFGESRMTHAMLFTGVDLGPDGAPRRWRVENSWGEANGRKGIYVMADSWIDEYLYEIAAPKKYLSAEALKALQEEPIHLPPWDPMGALAREGDDQ